MKALIYERYLRCIKKKIPLPFGAGLYIIAIKTLAATIVVWRFFGNLNIVWMRFT